MKQSIGYTVTLNIVIVFITIVIAFICAALIYFKSNKVSNVITNAIEKYEGYNSLSINEINMNLTSIGYSGRSISCAPSETSDDITCTLKNDGTNGYCVYYCEESNNYYFYKVRTNMAINIPIINELLNIPIYSNTNRLYDFASYKAADID